MSTAAVISEVGKVLIASANARWREQLLMGLEDSSGRVYEASGGADALSQLEQGEWQMLYLDRRVPDLDAEELISLVRARFPRIEVVLLDSGATASARFGDPAQPGGWQTRERSIFGIDRVPANRMCDPLPGMVGQSPAMQEVYHMVRVIAPRATTVLILGASGTGKELVSRAVHQLSPRQTRPLVVVNCAAIPETLLESELFGFSRGAFTGAAQSYGGRIQAASGGTLFLDEVGDLPASLQAKLLRFLEQKEVQRLGSSETLRVDARVVAATNADLMQKVDAGTFREDLYFRLAAFPVTLPNLTDHLEDLPALVDHFLERLAADGRNPKCSLNPAALQRLESHPWRGNVRELQHVIERAAILAGDGEVIFPEHLRLPKRSGVHFSSDFEVTSGSAAAD